MPDDPICPACQRLTSVTWTGKTYWCDSCDLGFIRGDHQRVSADWRARFHELRHMETHPQPPAHVERWTPQPICRTCNVRHPTTEAHH